MNRLLWGLAAVLAMAAHAQAEPLDSDQVAANARWVVHIDADAFRSADHARKIVDGWLSRDPVKKQLAWLDEKIGFDPAQDLHSLTLYGARVEVGRGVSIVRAAVDRKRLVAYLKDQPGYKTDSHGGHRLHVFQTPARGEQLRDEQLSGSIVGFSQEPAAIVFGRNTGEVAVALDVLDGKAPGLAADSPLVKDITPGTILWFAADALTESQLAFRSPFARHSKQFLLALGEHDRKVFLEATLLTDSEEHAAQMRQVVEKFRGVAGQQPGGRENFTRVFQSLEVSGTGQTVNVRWRPSGDDVVKLFEVFQRPMPTNADWQRRQDEFRKKLLEKYDKNQNGEIDDHEKEAIRAEWTKKMDARKGEWSKRMEEHKKRKKDR